MGIKVSNLSKREGKLIWEILLSNLIKIKSKKRRGVPSIVYKNQILV